MGKKKGKKKKGKKNAAKKGDGDAANRRLHTTLCYLWRLDGVRVARCSTFVHVGVALLYIAGV